MTTRTYVPKKPIEYGELVARLEGVKSMDPAKLARHGLSVCRGGLEYKEKSRQSVVIGLREDGSFWFGSGASSVTVGNAAGKLSNLLQVGLREVRGR